MRIIYFKICLITLVLATLSQICLGLVQSPAISPVLAPGEATSYAANLTQNPRPPVLPPGILEKTNRTEPALFTNTDTSFKLYGSKNCPNVCKRRNVKHWSRADWDLYGDLYVEANNRGYLADMVWTHEIDGSRYIDNVFTFHFTKALMPWHRFYITHFEQLLQKIDHEINPGRASHQGEFCLGYWDYGYQEPFSNSLQDDVYKYIFNEHAMGTLQGTMNDGILRNITDSKFAYFEVPAGSGNFAIRSAIYGQNQWNSATISACLSMRDFEGNDTYLGFTKCIEYLPHATLHTAFGINSTMFNVSISPRDPTFFLHHTMLDYVFWIWQGYSNNNMSAFDSTPMPQPYTQWNLKDSLAEEDFCYYYDAQVGVRTQYNGTYSVPSNVSHLDSHQKDAVDRLLSQGKPICQSKENYAPIKHVEYGPQADAIYASYLSGCQMAQDYYDTVNTHFNPLAVAPASLTLPAPSSYPVSSPPAQMNPHDQQKKVATFFQYMTGANAVNFPN